MTVTSKYGQADYLQALQNYLPRGVVWPREHGTELTDVLQFIAAMFQDVDTAGMNMLVHTFPPTMGNEFFAEWDETVGFQALYGSPASLFEAQIWSTAILGDEGGQSVQYFIDYATTLGYSIVIWQLMPATVMSPVNSPMYGLQWKSVWQVNVATGTDVTQLQAMLDRYAPAHTFPLIVFV